MRFLSGYRIMWILVMFDLPVLTKKERKEATAFRNYLLDMGFERCQFSVYIRCCADKEKVRRYIAKICQNLPKGGKIDILQFTDKQYENIVSFRGLQPKKAKKVEQLVLF